MKMETAKSSQGTVRDSQLDERPLGVSVMTRPMGAHSVREGAVTTLENNVVTEPAWDLMKMVERPQVIGTFRWAASYPTLQTLASYDLPWDIFTGVPFMSIPFYQFYLWRGEIELHIQCNGTPFHQGTVVMYYLPGNISGGTKDNLVSTHPSSLTSLQHVILHANSATSACMTIPFINPRLYIDLERGNGGQTLHTLGSLRVAVFNPLITGASATNAVDVSVIAQFRNSQFKVPRPYRGEGILERWLGETPGTFVQRMLPENFIRNTVDTVADFVGLDRPTSIERGPPMKMVGTQYHNSAVDIDYNDKMTLFPHKMQMVDPMTFGVDLEEMDMQYLTRKYTYLGSFSQTTTQVAGTVLASIPMSPCPVPLVVGDTITSVANTVPLLEYLSLPFAFWKGGLTYKLQVVASSFHVTKLFVAMQYGKYGPIPSTPLSVVDLTTQYGYAFEVNQGATEFEFTVPYVSPSHQLHVPSGEAQSDLDCMGSIYIVVLNTLSAPTGVAATISYNMYIAGASDFALNTLGGSNQGVTIAAVPAPGFVGESILTSPMTDTQMAKDGEVISPGKIRSRTDLNEASIKSLSEVMKKYYHAFTQKLVLQPNLSEDIPNSVAGNYKVRYLRVQDLVSPLSVGAPAIVDTMRRTQFNRFDYFSLLFAGYRGPLRVKIILRSVPTGYSCKVTYLPPYPFLASGPTAQYYNTYQWADAAVRGDQDMAGVAAYAVPRIPNHSHIANSVQKSVEIEIPYTTPYLYSTTTTRFDEDDAQLGTLQLVFYPPALGGFEGSAPAVQPVEYDVFVALGDESRYGVFQGTPLVAVASALHTEPPYAAMFPATWNVNSGTYFTLQQLPI